jgi:hypothetical protein
MGPNRAALDAGRIGRWLDDPALAARRTLYLLLLGLAGGPADAARIDRPLAARRPGDDAALLPALLAAHLELHGPAALPRFERRWLLDPARSPVEVQSALVALSVHGNDGGRIPRAAVAEAFLRLVRERRAHAAWVAQDLAGWEVWAATTPYAALADAPDLTFAARIAILQYLRESPLPEAKAAVERAMRPLPMGESRRSHADSP